jgi:hypothetical protein
MKVRSLNRLGLRISCRSTDECAERYARIERENRILLSRMQSIGSRQPTYLGTGGVQPSVLSASPGPTYAIRRRELQRIQEENAVILRRLQNTESQFDRSKWAEERAAAEQM